MPLLQWTTPHLALDGLMPTGAVDWPVPSPSSTRKLAVTVYSTKHLMSTPSGSGDKSLFLSLHVILRSFCRYVGHSFNVVEHRQIHEHYRTSNKRIV